jgi:hypothetical protein
MSKPAEKREEQARFVAGSGNVFADLGLPNSEEALARARERGPARCATALEAASRR